MRSRPSTASECLSTIKQPGRVHAEMRYQVKEATASLTRKRTAAMLDGAMIPHFDKGILLYEYTKEDFKRTSPHS